MVIGFICSRSGSFGFIWVYSCAFGSLGSFGFIWPIPVDHLGSLDSFRRAWLGSFRFVTFNLARAGRGRDHADFVGFILTRPTRGLVHSASLGLLGETWGSYGSFGFIWPRPGGRMVH